MATTWMKALHRSGGIASALGRSLDYVENPDKTNDSELLYGFECDPFTAQAEFMFSKQQYAQRTGRDQGKHDVIAYHVRMSFKPGEVSAEKALELGRELGLRWTKGQHQFIVAAHTNTNNPHVHIIFNSVNLDCDKKFADFKRSAIALRRVSDRICLEHGLSIIEKPGLSKGYNRHEYLNTEKVPTVRDRLRDSMDAALPACKDFEGFLAALQAAGVEIKRGKQLAYKLPGGKKFSRQDTLGDDYSYEAILERIAGERILAPTPSAAQAPSPTTQPDKPSLLIDIQEKIQQGYGVGFEHFAKLRNLKEMSRTLIFLQEIGVDSYEDLCEKASAASKQFHAVNDRLKANEARLKSITELQKHIGTYGKTREVYKQYQSAKNKQKFYDEHAGDIILHKAAKKYFDEQDFKGKLPSMNSLKQEWAALETKRKKLYSDYKTAKEKYVLLATAKSNTDTMLSIPHDKRKTQERNVL